MSFTCMYMHVTYTCLISLLEVGCLYRDVPAQDQGCGCLPYGPIIKVSTGCGVLKVGCPYRGCSRAQGVLVFAIKIMYFNTTISVLGNS